MQIHGSITVLTPHWNLLYLTHHFLNYTSCHNQAAPPQTTVQPRLSWTFMNITQKRHLKGLRWSSEHGNSSLIPHSPQQVLQESTWECAGSPGQPALWEANPLHEPFFSHCCTAATTAKPPWQHMDFTATHSAKEIIRAEIFKALPLPWVMRFCSSPENKNGRRRAGKAPSLPTAWSLAENPSGNSLFQLPSRRGPS